MMFVALLGRKKKQESRLFWCRGEEQLQVQYSRFCPSLRDLCPVLDSFHCAAPILLRASMPAQKTVRAHSRSSSLRRRGKKMRPTSLERSSNMMIWDNKFSMNSSDDADDDMLLVLDEPFGFHEQLVYEAHLDLARDFVLKEKLGTTDEQTQESSSNSKNKIWEMLRPYLSTDIYLALAGLEQGVYKFQDLPFRLQNNEAFCLAGCLALQ